jgi:hypothetical protein
VLPQPLLDLLRKLAPAAAQRDHAQVMPLEGAILDERQESVLGAAGIETVDDVEDAQRTTPHEAGPR